MTTQIARLRKFEFIGIPYAPGDAPVGHLRAAAVPGVCRTPAPPLAKLVCYVT